MIFTAHIVYMYPNSNSLVSLSWTRTMTFKETLITRFLGVSDSDCRFPHPDIKLTKTCDATKFPCSPWEIYFNLLDKLDSPLKAPIATKVVSFCHLSKCFRSLLDKQCGPRSDFNFRSSLIWIHTVCFYTLISQ